MKILTSILLSLAATISLASAQTSGTFLSNPFFVNAVLPFLLVFVIVFAILQKTQILGEGKKQIDAIVALVVGLIVISFSYATGVIVTLVPFLAVLAVIILIFMILYGMVYKDKEFQIHKGLKIAFGILIGIAIIIAVIFATGAWDFLRFLFLSSQSSGFFYNVIFALVIVAAIAAVLWGSGKTGSK